MANGDSAQAAGMDVVPGTADVRNTHEEINKTRDYIAEVQNDLPEFSTGLGTPNAAVVRGPDGYAGGAYPTLPAHWTTKEYVDSYVAFKIAEAFQARGL